MDVKISPILQEDIKRYPYMVSEDTCVDFINQLLLDVLATATTATAEAMNVVDKFKAGTPDAQEFITNSIRYGHQLWKEVLKEIRNQHNHDDLAETAFLVFMESIANPNHIPYDQEDPKRIMPYHIGVETVIAEIAETATKHDNMCVDIMKRISLIKDVNLLHQFFQTFASMEKVYHDPSRYDDEDDLKNHYRLMKLYKQIMDL